MVPGRGLRGGNDGREVHSACGSGFLASAARGAFVPGYGRDSPGCQSSARRPRALPVCAAPREAILLPNGFLGLSAYEDARALGRRRRVSWGLEDRFERLVARTWSETPAFIYKLCQAAKSSLAPVPTRVSAFFRRWLGGWAEESRRRFDKTRICEPSRRAARTEAHTS